MLGAAENHAESADWVHLVVTDQSPTATATIIQDAGPNEGQQTIQNAGVAASVIEVPNMAYIRGNADAVTSLFGFPATQGPTLAGRWISLTPSDSDYTTVIEGVSLASALDEIKVDGTYTETARTTRDGQTVIGISGAASSGDAGGGTAGGGTATLYITTTKNSLPVEYDTMTSDGTERVVFSNWGQAVTISAPSGATPIASISGHP